MEAVQYLKNPDGQLLNAMCLWEYFNEQFRLGRLSEIHAEAGPCGLLRDGDGQLIQPLV